MYLFQNDINERSLSNKLRATLKRIHDNLILENDQLQASPPGASIDEVNRDKIAHPHISPIVDLSGIEKLHGLAERIVATESL